MVLHAVVLQRFPIKLPSSVVTVEGAGDVPRPVPRTLAASGFVMELTPAGVENSDGLKVTPGNICAASEGVFTMTLQYWIASCAIPT